MGRDYVASVGYGVCVKIKGSKEYGEFHELAYKSIISWWKGEEYTDIDSYQTYSDYIDHCPIRMVCGGNMLAGDETDEYYVLICLKDSLTKLRGYGGAQIIRPAEIEGKSDLLDTIIAMVQELNVELGKETYEDSVIDWHFVMEGT